MDRLLSAMRRHAGDQDLHAAHPRMALVTSVDADSHSVRLTLQPEGVLTGWVPVPASGVGGVTIVHPPSVGDQVFVSFQEGDHEHPVVTGRMLSSVDLPPRSEVTGKTVQPGELGIFANGAWLHLSGGTWNLKGNVIIDGNVTIKGTLTVEKTIKGLQDILAKAVSLLEHVHLGVLRGGQKTDKPFQ